MADHKELEIIQSELEKCREEVRAIRKTKSEIFHKEKLISIGQLSAGIAHEINNPLAFVGGNFSALLRYLKDLRDHFRKMEKLAEELDSSDSGKVEEYFRILQSEKDELDMEFIFDDIDNIENETQDGFRRIRNIISSLSEFSRYEARSVVDLMNVNETLNSALNVVWNKLKYTAEVEKDFQEDISDIEWLRNEIHQVLLNIIINAAQAIAEDSVNGPGRLTLKTRSDDENVRIWIQDTGHGIPKNLIKHIFDPFFTTKEVGKGTGLGLSISYDIIVNRHHGRITVESELDQGTTFLIELPVKYHGSKIEEDTQ